MAFTIDVNTTQKAEIARDYDTVFDTLADVPYSAAEFPRLQELVSLGEERYRWNMEPITLAAYTAQTIYACEYSWDREEGWIAWEPVAEEGATAVIQGRWDLKRKSPELTALTFHSEGTITLPFPNMARVIVAPLVSGEFGKLVTTYIENLRNFWENS